MESYYSAREMAEMHFMYGRANGNSWEARRFYVERMNVTESHRTNYSPNFTSF
jgi:hypothetical protein